MADEKKPMTTPVKPWTFDDHTNSYIRRAASTGIYDIRGGGAKPVSYTHLTLPTKA